MSHETGLLYSQIGYDIAGPKRTFVRAATPDRVPADAQVTLVAEGTGIRREIAVVSEGKHWGTWWWSVDFSDTSRPDHYHLECRLGEDLHIIGEQFCVGDSVLWDTTWRAASIEQLDVRADMARDNQGWQDCGAALREVNSHSHMIIGLADLLELGADRLSPDDTERVLWHIVRGCDYLALCQDTAEKAGHPKGTLIHEIPSHTNKVIPGDNALATVALARAACVLHEHDTDTARQYRTRAEAALDRLLNSQPHGPEGFDPIPHGLPDGAPKPDEFMTRDLATMLWGAVELSRNDSVRHRDTAVTLARRMLSRAISVEHAEDGLYGHFRTFEALDVGEKIWVHHGYGHDCGAVFPFYLHPLMQLCSRYPGHPDAPSWRQTVQDYAYHFLKPACSRNPFLLMPNGVYGDEGLLVFGGLWHGANVSYAYTAAQTLELAAFLDDPALRDIAVANLQWILGLNAGITAPSLAGCERWSDDIPEGVALPYSMMYGVGNRSAGTWTNIRGTICNGFNVDQQFKFVAPTDAAHDGPHLFTDEDWISHNGAWLQALVRL